MFGIIFYVALKEADKKENSSSEEEQGPPAVAGFFVCGGCSRFKLIFLGEYYGKQK